MKNPQFYLFFNQKGDLDATQLDPASDDFVNLKELAKRYALAFGVDQVRAREAIAIIHKEGIAFALDLEELKRGRKKQLPALPNISFLEILSEFSGRLTRQDKASV
jgi:cohesin complex subunit SA-1/2